MNWTNGFIRFFIALFCGFIAGMAASEIALTLGWPLLLALIPSMLACYALMEYTCKKLQV